MNTEEVIESVKKKMVLIPAGTFLMGSPKDEPERSNRETQQEVSVESFMMCSTTITFNEWDAIMGEQYLPDDEGWGRGERPVINVSWDDAQAFIERLNVLTGEQYRLPTEAEWEYAARAGTNTRFNTGDCITTDQANFNGNYPAQGCPEGEYRGETLPVGSFKPNAFGLYDMHGNVWELMEDCWDGNGRWPVLRGGSWNFDGGDLRSATRSNSGHGDRNYDIGFRLARDV